MKHSLLLTFCLILSISTDTFSQTRYFVNGNVAASGDGKSWGAAFKTVQEAIDAASPAVADEVWVAQGVYYPTKTPTGYATQTSHQATFFFNKHIRLYGGFNGSETQREQRNPQSQRTTLSGNINDPADSTDNSYHVVVISGTQAAPLGNDLVIDGFTIADGYAYYQGAFTVNGVVLYFYNGGGIYNLYASPVLNNLYIHRNNAFVGGGIHNQRSSPVISNSTITGNGYIAASSGGGIYNNLESSPHITNVLISGNASAEGGGVFNYNDSRPVFDQVMITANAASRGAGVANSNAQPVFRNTTISNNTARIDGGGIYNSNDGTIALTNVKILNNKAQFGGGARMFRSTVSFDGGEVSGNEAASYGGGMYIDGGNVNISGATVSNNKAVTYMGGGIYNVSTGELRVSNSTFSGNISRREGGAIYCAASTKPIFDQVNFISNLADNRGGAVYLGAVSGSSSLTSCTFTGNKGYGGGGIACVNASPAMNKLTFTENEAQYDGGGISLTSLSSPVMKNITLQNNKAQSGAGILIATSSVPVMEDVIATGNVATGDGGGMYISDYRVNPRLNRVRLSGNTAVNGGGLYVSSSAGPVLTNMVVTGNRAIESGAGIYIDEARPVLTNLTIAGNFAQAGTGGLYANGSTSAQIRNTIIYGNNSGFDFLNGRPGIFSSMIEGWATTANGSVLPVDPLFVSAVDPASAPFVGGDFSLQATTPLADKGNSSFYQAGMSPDLSSIRGDFLNNQRIAGASVDIGAYETGALPLPVTLISFTGKQKENTVVLEWKTSAEQNSDYFDVQRSFDGKIFESIGELPASYESHKVVSYEFLDQAYAVSRRYYRLKMVDKDGSFAFSRIINIGAVSVEAPSVFPNPAVGPRVSVRYSGKADIQLFNLEGKMLSLPSFTREQPGELTLDISSLRTGTYLLQIADETGVTTRRLAISH